MSTKRYCDLCDKPACENLDGALTRLPVGQPWTGFSGERQCDGSWQTNIVARVIFRFEEHLTGYGGPPDLCPECAAKLVKQLLEKIQP